MIGQVRLLDIQILTEAFGLGQLKWEKLVKNMLSILKFLIDWTTKNPKRCIVWIMCKKNLQVQVLEDCWIQLQAGLRWQMGLMKSKFLQIIMDKPIMILWKVECTEMWKYATPLSHRISVLNKMSVDGAMIHQDAFLVTLKKQLRPLVNNTYLLHMEVGIPK